MVTRLRRVSSLIAVLIGAVLANVACQRVPLLAPSGSVITLAAPAAALPVNGTTQLVATVVEAAGTAPQSGTLVTFTTTLGTIQPASAETDISGRAVATFSAGTTSGTATITAASGGASVAAANAVKILIGTAAVGRVLVSASPTLVPAFGGSTTIVADVLDINGNPLTAAPVSFTTTAGTLANVVVSTDANGLAQTTLVTNSAATVTASVGATGGAGTGTTPAPGTTTSGQASGTVSVGIASAPTLVITPPTAATAGLAAAFTFAVTAAATNGSAVRDVKVIWGDGQTQDLGTLTGSTVVSHVYRSIGTYVVSGTVIDSFGNSSAVSTSVTVNATPLALGITLTGTASAGLPAQFTLTPTAAAPGDAVRDVTVTWGDGQTQDLGAISGGAGVAHVYTVAGAYVITGTLTDTAGNSISSSTTVIVIPVSRPTILITPSPVPGHANTVETVSIQVTVASGISVVDTTIDFGDGTKADLGGATSASVSHVYTAPGTYTVIVTVTDSTGLITLGTLSVSIGV